jgi:NAD(P)-dependent dehydrogenase (short-subunit alcohol dehydrogenase family)
MRVGKDTVVVVTGASGGVGRATVRLLAERGARIGLLARGRDGLEAAKREVQERGGQALIVPTDVSQFEQVQEAAEVTERTFGGRSPGAGFVAFMLAAKRGLGVRL